MRLSFNYKLEGKARSVHANCHSLSEFLKLLRELKEKPVSCQKMEVQLDMYMLPSAKAFDQQMLRKFSTNSADYREEIAQGKSCKPKDEAAEEKLCQQLRSGLTQLIARTVSILQDLLNVY